MDFKRYILTNDLDFKSMVRGNKIDYIDNRLKFFELMIKENYLIETVSTEDYESKYSETEKELKDLNFLLMEIFYDGLHIYRDFLLKKVPDSLINEEYIKFVKYGFELVSKKYNIDLEFDKIFVIK